jgi:hypothetical protein
MHDTALPLRLLAIALGLAWLASAPALAQDDPSAEAEEGAGWGLIETTPENWPWPVYLPDYGELVMVGYEGATREDVDEPYDFQWFYEAPAGSGEISLVQGFFLPADGEISPTVWEDYDSGFADQLSASGVNVLWSEPNAQYGGRRWLMYGLSSTGADDEGAEADELALVTFGDGGMTFLDVFYDMPPNEDIDAMLSLITGGPDAPQ